LLGNEIVEISVAPENSPAANFGFDVTPRHFVTGLITERGVCKADEQSILELFPERIPENASELPKRNQRAS
jgi:methylthioribose-1-phosphate isomerase